MQEDAPKPLTEHLEDLRGRLIAVLLTLLAGTAGGYAFADGVLEWLIRPVGQLFFLSPTEAFLVRLKVSFFIGVVVSVPVFFYQVYRFVGVGLTAAERRAIFGMLPFSLILFAAGAAFGWWAVIPAALKFLLGFGTASLKPMISASHYLGFIFWLCIGFGAMFQLPIVILILVRLGVVEPWMLRHYRRHALLAIAIVSAVLTPGPDLFSQLALIVPTYLLYEISIWIAHFRT